MMRLCYPFNGTHICKECRHDVLSHNNNGCNATALYASFNKLELGPCKCYRSPEDFNLETDSIPVSHGNRYVRVVENGVRVLRRTDELRIRQ